MGMDTLGVMAGHHSVGDIVEAMREALPNVRVGARQLTGPNVWIIEAVNSAGAAIVVTAYLNSYAAGDYPELDLAESTLLLMEHGPQSQSVIRAIINGRQGWMKPHDQAEWQTLGPNHD